MLSRMAANSNRYAGNGIAGAMQSTMRRLSGNPVLPLPADLRLASDSGRDGRLKGLFDGLFGSLAAESQFEARVKALRDATNDMVAFRQALWLLLKVEKIDEVRRPIIAERAMRWFRARIALGRSAPSNWGKSMVRFAAGCRNGESS